MSKNNPKGLGKGLDALFQNNTGAVVELGYGNETIHQLPIDSVYPNSDQPRKQFNEDSLQELAISIGEFGILQPLIVTKNEQNMYSIIAGERRWRAAKIAKLKMVPAIIRSSSELETLEVALIENVQREDLSPLDQALSIERLHDQFSMSYEAIAAKLGKAYSTVANIARLLQLPPPMQQALNDKVITEGHARALLSLQKDPEQQKALYELILAKHLSVRQAEQYVVGSRGDSKAKQQAISRTQSASVETKKLSKKYGMQVSVQYLAKGGKISFRFRSEEEYKDLIDKLM